MNPSAKRSGTGNGIRAIGLSIAASLVLVGTVLGQSKDPSPPTSRVLTNFTELWTLTRQEKSEPQRIQTEVVIDYFDAEWNSAWGECHGTRLFLPLGDSPTPLKPGQRVAIDGLISPMQQRMIWDRTRLTILDEGLDRPAEKVINMADNPVRLKGHKIQVEGLIDSQKIDPTHISINFIANGMTATVYVLRDPASRLPFKNGDFIRVNCIYAPQLNRDGQLVNLDLWAARQTDVQVTGSLRTDERFATPRTPIEDILEDLHTNQLVCVRGVVHKHEAGKWAVIWDDTGQVTLLSKQTMPMEVGDRVEAVGYPYVVGIRQFLRNGLYRPAPPQSKAAASIAPPQLRLTEQVRELTREEAGRGVPVQLRASVLWSHPGIPFAYVQDGSGGIRVLNPKWDAPETSKPGTIVLLEGTTSKGDFVPAITNAELRRVGWWNLYAEPAQLVHLEQAMTGMDEGCWVEMRGYVRHVTATNGLRRIELTTTSGEFEAWVASSRGLKSLEGSIVRVLGVCTASANPRHQLTGIQIWIPESRFILVEEPESADLFSAPLRPLDSLRRFSTESGLHRRIRTSGTVILHEPGRYLYVQDGVDAVLALSRQSDRLKLGDRVEVVGFPGNQGRRILLREAAYRRLGPGAEPVPIRIPAANSVDLELEGLLATADGVLLNSSEKNRETRLLIHARNSTFEVSLDSTQARASNPAALFVPGNRLAVTGVYEVQSDEYGNPRSFLLRLRSWNDVRLLQRAPWWTLAHLLWLLLGVLAVSILALAWGLLISHKNRLLRTAQTQLKSVNDLLEQRVEERTRELELQVSAKERARAELAEAQEHLVLTSRKAGMAEVATGVLHNVGNVLNSVNVSASILKERLRHCPMESVGKAAALLRKNEGQLPRFLTDDPKGRAIPGYLEKLGNILVQDKNEMRTEFELLVKNIDHIKVIVAMQQSYAKIGGVLEELDPKDLLEDALQINSASLLRERIQLVREYQPTPRVLVDRHKVLQILVNLVSNARHALESKPSGRVLTLAVSATAPDQVQIVVRDNGAGITPENLDRIFSQGFTTRKDGHGFGLHSGSIAAKELGGSLTVESAGPDQGAAFYLRLPGTAPISISPAPVPVDPPVADRELPQPSLPG